MDFEQAELRFRELKAQCEMGTLDEAAYRVEVAKLLFRDQRGAFWMLDAGTGDWFCNEGKGWKPGDPRTVTPLELFEPEGRKARRRPGWPTILGVLLLVAAGVAGFLTWQEWGRVPAASPVDGPGQISDVQVTIASPADGSQVVLGQEVAIESTINAPSLRAVGRVNLVVGGKTVNSLLVGPRVQEGQTSLPISQPWLPTDAGEYQVAVLAFSAEGELLAGSTMFLVVREGADTALAEPTCVPNAAFVEDVTIPPNTAFPPGARMEKVWQVRNSGTCAWGVGYELVLVEGDSLGAPGAVPVPPTAAGQVSDLSVTLWAPEAHDTYSSIWRLQAPDGLFFGPNLNLDIQVQELAEESQPPAPPTDLQATVAEDGQTVKLKWLDQSDDEDAFRIYREDVEASIGLAPADAVVFMDENTACGNTYRYVVIAFNAAGVSAVSEMAEVTLPPCAPIDEPPTLELSVSPVQVLATEPFTIAFVAEDDLGLNKVTLQGEESGHPMLDAGRTYTCSDTICSGGWSLTWTHDISTSLQISVPVTVIGSALDNAGQQSEPAWTTVIIIPGE
jgi:hypothetical protein